MRGRWSVRSDMFEALPLFAPYHRGNLEVTIWAVRSL